MYYACDFETTTDIDDCRVWAWGSREIYTEIENTGKDIEDFINWCIQVHGSKLWFHNLKFDGTFIVYWLLKNEYKWTDKKTLNEKEFTTIISDMGQWYQIKIRFEDKAGIARKIEILDSLKIIPMSVEEMPKAFGLEEHKLTLDYDKYRPVGYEMTADERAYLLADVRILAKVIKIMFDNKMKQMTVASNALKSFRGIYGSKHKYHFPKLDTKTDADIRKTYKGGFTYLNPNYQDSTVGAGAVYDINSMYPWAMKYCRLPFGHPVFFKGEYKPSTIFNLYTICIRCSFKLKPGRIPSIQIKKSWKYNETEYLINSGGEVVLNLTCVDYELFLHNYDVEIYETYGGYMFRSKVGIFAEYVDNWYDVKDRARSSGNVAQERIAKLMLNSLYGKFGASKSRKYKMPYLDDDKLKFHVMEGKEVRGGYLPIATFITSYCRDKIIRAAEICGDRFVYADTDSLHILGTDPIPGLDIDNHRLGAFKLESTFVRAKFLRQKTYYEIYVKDGKENMNLKAAGMPNKAKEKVTEDNFVIGAEFDGKLVPKIVPGGVILQDTTFTIKKAKATNSLEFTQEFIDKNH